MGTGSAAELPERREHPCGQRRCLSPFFGRWSARKRGTGTAAHPVVLPGSFATFAAEPVPFSWLPFTVLVITDH